MDLKNLKIDWTRVLITAGIVIFSALVVGGTTWYVMDKGAREVDAANEAQAEELQTKISKLEEQAAEEPATDAIDEETPANSPTTTATATGLTTLEAYCKTSNDGVLIPAYSYMKNSNGEYLNCYVGDGESGGGFLIAKFKNGAWAKLWSGNGVIETSVCDADKIPNKMSGGTCNY